ncbi:hypothetical protein [Actinophytocola sp.]|uniref:hypothetical protein n=1 Tax=Actinophytocola sp. TaxID=1872138 RepID=UPI003D6B54D1
MPNLTRHQPATTPDDLAHLFAERANAGDAAGLVALYEPEAVLAFPSVAFAHRQRDGSWLWAIDNPNITG